MALGAALSFGCARPTPELGARSEAPEYGSSPALPPLSPEALARLGGEPAPASSTSAAANASAAAILVPRLPGTPEATPDGDYRLAAGGLEVVIGAQLDWQVRSISLEGKSCLVPEGRLGAGAAAGAAPLSPRNERLRYEVDVEGSTLIVRGGADDGSFRSTKRYRLDAARRALEITYGFENTGARPVALSSEEYWRVPSAGSLTFAPIVKGVSEPKGTLKLNVWQPVLWFTPGAVAGWTTIQASDGWLATASPGLLLVRSFTDVPRGVQGHPVVIQAELGRPTAAAPTVDEARIAVQGARLDLAPGAKAGYTTRWLARRLPDGITIKAGNQELLGFARGVIQ